MSWIKPNFLWMMYRCGWGTKFGQEVVLAIGLAREAFDRILADAVHSSYVAEVYGSQEAWQAAVGRSCVRLQWDPDHDPFGNKMERRAIQLGLRGAVLEAFADESVRWIEDISPFVAEQRDYRGTPKLMTPLEPPYEVDAVVAKRLGVERAAHAAALLNA